MRSNITKFLMVVSTMFIAPFVCGMSFGYWRNTESDVTINLQKISYNKLLDNGYELSFNKFINKNDFERKYQGYNPKTIINNRSYTEFPNFAPSFVDWRNSSIVGPIKDQKQCGSCWAFSAVSSLESQVMKVLGKSLSLSEQDMVDCVKNIKSPDGYNECCDGCQGGEMYSVYQYLMNNQHGSDDTENQYPYLAFNGDCHPKVSAISNVILKDYVSLPKGDEDALKKAVYNIGPISVGVDANQDWQLYSKGIYDPSKSLDGCSSDMSAQDHGVAVVGYGIENEKEYWIIRNSWGESWGEDGYMRLVMGLNACGVANSAIYPIVSKK